jgi:hypothetical protein
MGTANSPMSASVEENHFDVLQHTPAETKMVGCTGSAEGLLCSTKGPGGACASEGKEVQQSFRRDLSRLIGSRTGDWFPND